MRLLVCFVLAICWLQPHIAQEVADEVKVEEHPAPVMLSIEDLLKLPGKQLRSMLDKKGVVCKGCSEKIDFVNRVFETQGLPDVEPPKPIVEEGKGLDKEKIDELLDDLRRRGFTDKDGNIVSGSDFSNMSPEEMIAAMNRGKPPPKMPKKKRSKTKDKILDEFEATTTSEDKKAAAEDKAAKDKAAKAKAAEEKAAKEKASKAAKARKAANEKLKKAAEGGSSSSSSGSSSGKSSSSKASKKEKAAEKSEETIEL